MPYRHPQLPLPAWLEAIGGGTFIFAVVLSLVALVVVMTVVEAYSPLDDSARPLSLPVRP